ncbi:phage antirepressor N-terminal domain-containing protein [Desulfosporosinus sp. Sb-LF]|uniref:phage antirepressor N-terminal domain-containing protein n=1 Tax=Desulfosporosinus sp. Sb-LF TaxID=2560027 RepID=UPI00107FBF7D|nr:phage antirepressor N-terminal domain-containing protein [Desulfosporosinus sp. Sb-LF]TGE31455.1 hypothetical protein E4K68_17160 [Desulfosporosinus sp. Sb-LF]
MSNLIPVEQKLVDFNGSELMVIKSNDGKIRVGVKWVANGIGLDKSKSDVQVQKIQSDLVLSRGACKINLPTSSGNQEILCLELDFLPLWLAKINANIIDHPGVQERLISYQLKAKDVLAAAFIESKPTSIEDVLIAQLQSMKDIKLKQEQQDESIKLLAAKIETHPKDFFSIAGYASLRGFKVDISRANLLGRKASKLSRDYGVQMGKVTDPRFGQVNTYHLDILKEAFN